jgi:ATP-dependent Lon protease
MFTTISSSKETIIFIKNKIKYIYDVIRSTIFSVQNNKRNDILSNSDVNNCISTLTELYNKIKEFENFDTSINEEKLLDDFQSLLEKLSVVICSFGTYHLKDLLNISFGSHFTENKNENILLQEKQDLIHKYIHPFGYKTVNWKKSINYNQLFNRKTLCSDKITDEFIIIENACNFECFDIDVSSAKSFYHKINGIRVVLQNEKIQKTIIINGIIDDIVLDCFSNKYIDYRKNDIYEYIRKKYTINDEILKRIIDCLTLKDILIYSNEDIYKKYNSIISEINTIQQNKINTIIKNFVEMDMYSQRSMLINLFLYNNNDEIQYISYLLYDLITTYKSTSADSNEQILIYDSLPWKIKMYFKDIMKFTIKYTQDMNNKYDINRVSFEQQIYLMKAPEYIKEKAMTKLKEIKGKNDDSCIKTRQYLDALLKIPFGIFKEEPILKIIKETNQLFVEATKNNIINIPIKIKYSIHEINKYITEMDNSYKNKQMNEISAIINKSNTKQLISIIHFIEDLIKTKKINYHFNINRNIKENRIIFINNFLEKNVQYRENVYNYLKDNNIDTDKTILSSQIINIKKNTEFIDKSVKNINDVLDESIFGHDHAKKQILKIIAQWMNGEQGGYCFGFEGSPGVGKTSLAKKGLAKCLVDENGISRPFAFIALGGSSNGSTLEGHSYTYVNSTWGRITDILMETKCMNPIIYIDELDKVSKTEHGKEIIGILTHLIDTTQNDTFQDKYFSGINLDLSKVLFIFSYNDPDQIDRILLDRIHRIRFDNLSLDDKMVIVSQYIIPEINKKMGFANETVELSDDVIEYIIETYTLEPGVRKLKEVLFDLFGEINIELLKYESDINIPFIITKDLIDNKYLKKYYKIEYTKIHEENQVGIINGLWANSLGKGGIIPIETNYFPTSNFLDLKLTGLQGDVMKESMNVAKTLAWNLTNDKQKTLLLKKFNDTKCQGLHVHCPQGAVSKDGPSAGTAITIAIYSLFNSLKIKNNIAITGEINLQGQVTAIGGLESKILGGIRGGVTTFLFPKSNSRDFKEFMEKYESKSIISNIEFIEISHIQETIKYVFE